MTFLPTILAWLALSAVLDAPPAVHGKVTRILDGDCVAVEVIVRLEMVDAPERSQPGGKEAKQFVEDFLLDRQVRFYPHYRSYNRTVGAMKADGADVALALVEHGHAWVDPRYNTRKDLVEAQAEARREMTGLWKEPAVEPWRWRKGER